MKFAKMLAEVVIQEVESGYPKGLHRARAIPQGRTQHVDKFACGVRFLKIEVLRYGRKQ